MKAHDSPRQFGFAGLSGRLPPSLGDGGDAKIILSVAMMSHTVYVIRSRITGMFYKGSCEDFEKRLGDHNAGRVRSTKNGRPWQEHYREELSDKTAALKREKHLKSRSGYRWLKDKGIISRRRGG